MTVVEKAAYLKGLVDGLGVEPDSKEGKLWNALTDVLSDMAHEIEDLQSTDLDFADAIDEIGEELSYLEEITCDLDVPPEPDDDEFCSGNCSSCGEGCFRIIENEADEKDDDDDDDGDEEDDGLVYDGVVYDLTCPSCGEDITVDEETLAEGSMLCPSCGEKLEFELDD